MKQTTIRKHIQNLVTAAMLMAVGIVLPFFTEIGRASCRERV